MLLTMKGNKVNTHPHRYMMWITIASIVMMFAGLSSAFIVKRSQANWITYRIPLAFYYSTAVIIFSSISVMMARKAFSERQMSKYTRWLTVTAVLGCGFVMLQYLGFTELWKQGVTVTRNVSFSFLYVLVGIHAIHVIGGLVALIIMLFKSLNKRQRMYSEVPISVMGTYWHFVDILWVYLLIFLIVQA